MIDTKTLALAEKDYIVSERRYSTPIPSWEIMR